MCGQWTHSLSSPVIKANVSLLQILVSHGLEALVEDHLFMSMTKRDVAATLEIDPDDMERAAATMLNDYQGRMNGSRQHHPTRPQRGSRNSLQSETQV